ncbi:TonB-dependent Receptor Plug Domain [Flavobacterium aquidurense]|uniref:TonB-dependent receptor n=1 Tax=Flavobacterium frigidimaris TaxID=262320 RepID=A0ABX4BRL0_FLAFR|nr:TonB-dependent receptor [Flavobacterium frigidimaris]OXA79875.1 TonB-dependent receptor [Flavobacterium frigidimaris]SDZ39508.1 TonB-dependent Receptor Plug Domain [Flavobacterium aquidurense]
MRKIILALFLLTFHALSFSQEKTKKISIEFNNTDLKSALENIEKTTDYTFYFDQNWFKNEPIIINKKYENTSVEDILTSIFEKTDLNFFISDKEIILTKNSIIYDALPDDYFEPSTTAQPNKVEAVVVAKPVFQQQYDTLKYNKVNSGITYIGKEKKGGESKFYTLSGFIKNKKTGKTVSNVSIKVRGKDISTVTDNDGHYTIEVPFGLNYIEVASINHKKDVETLMVYDNGKLDLDLYENINELDEVIIKKNADKNVKNVIAGVSSIDVEGIKNIPLVLGERDIFRVATTLPGIKTTGEGSAGFNVRGGKDDQNLILLDNAVLYNTSHFLGFFSAVNPYTTSKVDIYKGSIPARFGGRLSSVFDIASKNGNPEKFSGEGGIGSVTSNLTIGTPIVKNKSSLLVGVRTTYSEWILKSLDDEQLKNSQAAFFDGIIKYNHKINTNNNIESTLYYSKDRFSISSDSVYKYSNALVSLKWNHAFNSKSKADLILTNSNYKFNIDYDNGTPNSFNYGYKLNETQFIVNANYSLNSKHAFNYGISSKLYNVDPGYLNPKDPKSTIIPINIEDEKALESAVYFSDNYTLSEKILISMGLRYSSYSALGESTQRIYENNAPVNDNTVVGTQHYKNNEVIKTYGGFEPRIAARYLFTDDFSVKASFDKTYQYIHLLTNNTTQSPTDSWKLSDLNIAPQEAQQYSLGFYKNLDNDNIELSLEGYYKKSNNLLDYKVGSELLLNENTETQLLQGEGKAYGVEFLLKKNAGKLNGWLGYTYSRTFIRVNTEFIDEKVNNGHYFPTSFDKPHEVSAVLNYKFTKRYSLSGNFVYQSGRPITYPIGSYVYNGMEYTLYSDRNKFRIPDYYRLDLGFNIEGNHKIKKLSHSFWNISVYNVLGRNNPYSIFFITKEGQIKAYKTSIFSVPIPTITYNVKF